MFRSVSVVSAVVLIYFLLYIDFIIGNISLPTKKYPPFFTHKLLDSGFCIGQIIELDEL